jgi:hypothetical protein
MVNLGPASRSDRRRHAPVGTPAPDPFASLAARPATSTAGDQPELPLPTLLDRAVTSRANVLIEGGTEPHRALLAQLIHARSWQKTGRIFACIAADVLTEEVEWAPLLSGSPTVLGGLLGASLAEVAGTVGTLYLEHIDALGMESQQRLAAALKARHEAVGPVRPGPRLIAGLATLSPPGNSALEDGLERYGFLIHVVLPDGRPEFVPEAFDGVLQDLSRQAKLRIEVW